MAVREPFAVDEWYHCFNRGVDKRCIFETNVEYERFLALLYICNGSNKIRLSEQWDTSLESIVGNHRLDRGKPLVALGAYALMPNHFHLLCREITDGGIALFMQKICTGYTMYFNKKYQRTGSLLGGTFKSRHVGDDRYFKQVIAYILLNPAELFEQQWKAGKGDIQHIKKHLMQYPYSSLPDLLGEERLHGCIITDVSEYYDTPISLEQMARDAHEYYKEKTSKV